MNNAVTEAEWATTFREIWQDQRGDIFIGAGPWKEFNIRNEMRWNAWRYAGCRGWTVALTPPQRQKGKRG